MITRQEIILDTDYVKQTDEVQKNIEDLVIKINKIRQAYGKPMIITSGFRTMEHHLEIYAERGITDKSKIPMKSKHLYGLALDVLDPKAFLKSWIKSHMSLCEEVGFYFEAFSATPTWVHFQTVPPASGKRFFNP